MPDLRIASPLPSHARIEQWLMRSINDGELLPGDKLPTEGELAAALGVSRMTLRQALASLEAKGVLLRRRGRGGGNFIAQPKIECDLTGLAGFTEQMRRAQLRAGARVIRADTVPASRTVAAALGLARGAAVHEIVRVRSANREPLALERSYFPAETFPDLLDHRLTGSLYALIRRLHGQPPRTARESLEPVVADPAEAELLGIEVGTPLMLIERTAYTAAGLAVEFAYDLFRSDRIRITLRTGIGAPAGAELTATPLDPTPVTPRPGGPPGRGAGPAAPARAPR